MTRLKPYAGAVAVCCSLLLVLVLPRLAQAQTDELNQRIVRFALFIDGEPAMEASARRDDMVTVEIDNRGHYGFLPSVRSDGAVAIEVYSIASGKREPRLLETLSVKSGQRVILATDPGLAIQVSEILTNSKLLSDRRNAITLASFTYVPFRDFAIESSGCCVKCENVTVCGCAVTMSCGCCCAGCDNPDCHEIECSSPLVAVFPNGSSACGERFDDLIARIGSHNLGV